MINAEIYGAQHHCGGNEEAARAYRQVGVAIRGRRVTDSALQSEESESGGPTIECHDRVQAYFQPPFLHAPLLPELVEERMDSQEVISDVSFPAADSSMDTTDFSFGAHIGFGG